MDYGTRNGLWDTKWIMGHEMDNRTRNGLWDTKWIKKKNDTFRPFIRLKNLLKSFGIVQLMVKQRLRLCFAFVCNSTENTFF